MKKTMETLRRKFAALNPRATLAALVVFGLLFRILLMQFRFAVGFDEVNYLKLGVSGHLHGLAAALHAYWPPFFPWLISLCCSFTSNYEVAGRLVSILAGALLAVPVYGLGKLAYDKNAGLLAAAFVTFFPALAFHSTLILTEATFAVLVALAFLAGWHMLQCYSMAGALAAGVLSGCLYLTRPEGIGFLFIFAGWILVATIFKIFLIRPLRAVYLLLSLGFGFFVVSTPYLLYLKNSTGVWTISAKGRANLQMDSPEDGGRPSFRALNASNTAVPIDEVFHLGTFVKPENNGESPLARNVSLKNLAVKYVENIYLMTRRGIPTFLTTLPLILLGIGLLGHKWEYGLGVKNAYFLSFIAVYWFAVVPLFHVNERYLLSLWPLCAVWIGNGAKRLYMWLQEYRPRAGYAERHKMTADRAKLIVIALFLTLSFLPELAYVIGRHPGSKDVWADAVEQRIAGRWIKENHAGRPIIMSRNHAADFYAGNYDVRESVTIPDADVDRVLAYARYRGVTHIVLNERYQNEYPRLCSLLQGENIPPGLETAMKINYPDGLTTVIYRVW